MNTVIKVGINFNSKYGKKLTDTAIKTGKDFAMIAGKKIVHKSAGATGDLIGNKIADNVTAKPSPKDVTSASKNNIMKKYSQMKLIMKYQREICSSKRKTKNY